jgi:hypothetical protein
MHIACTSFFVYYEGQLGHSTPIVGPMDYGLDYVLRYIARSMDYGLDYVRGDGVMLIGYIDSDWAGCAVDKKST